MHAETQTRQITIHVTQVQGIDSGPVTIITSKWMLCVNKQVCWGASWRKADIEVLTEYYKSVTKPRYYD